MSASNPERPNPSPEPAAPEQKRRNAWIWVSGVLAVVAIGLLVWGLATRSDLESTQDDVADLQTQVDQGKQAGSSFATAAKGAVSELTQQLGATNEDLADAEKAVGDANAAADQAQADADAAKQDAADAKDETAKAKAEADHAKAEASIAKSKGTIAADCAKAYVSAIGTLFEGDDVAAQAASVRGQLAGITADCQAALAGT
ncbi:MAG TPA: hypothetical protein VFN44_07335 [Solirubrobacteraceae bacterium]|nr:hypothetical protein [Solirubrobacteraceae bacterium]